MSAKNLDGVNFDFEGEGSGDRNGLTSLITQVSHALHAANPHWQVTMATYASAAADSGGFYDIAALAPAVDGFFVMAYDMNDRSVPSPTAPLVGGSFNDTEALQQFTAVVPPSKVILGVPYYGYDWPTTDGTSTAQATGAESPLSDGVIAASGHPTYWDPSTDTVWTSYQVGTQWHETYFDNPTSLAMKAQLANSFHIAGLGIWALGMDGNNPAMLAALLGNAPAVKDYQTGPTTSTPDHRPCRHRLRHHRELEGDQRPPHAHQRAAAQRHGPVPGLPDVSDHQRSCAGLPADRAPPGRVVLQHAARSRRGRRRPATGLRGGPLVVHTAATDDRPRFVVHDAPHTTTTTDPTTTTTTTQPTSPSSTTTTTTTTTTTSTTTTTTTTTTSDHHDDAATRSLSRRRADRRLPARGLRKVLPSRISLRPWERWASADNLCGPGGVAQLVERYVRNVEAERFESASPPPEKARSEAQKWCPPESDELYVEIVNSAVRGRPLSPRNACSPAQVAMMPEVDESVGLNRTQLVRSAGNFVPALPRDQRSSFRIAGNCYVRNPLGPGVRAPQPPDLSGQLRLGRISDKSLLITIGPQARELAPWPRQYLTSQGWL